jgi:hypothetical protein
VDFSSLSEKMGSNLDSSPWNCSNPDFDNPYKSWNVIVAAIVIKCEDFNPKFSSPVIPESRLFSFIMLLAIEIFILWFHLILTLREDFFLKFAFVLDKN